MHSKDDHIGQLKYTLAKRIRDMGRGFIIQTTYSDFEIDREDAPAFMELATDVIKKQLKGLDAI